MKVFSMVLLVSVLSVFLLTGNALAIPVFTGDPVADFYDSGEPTPNGHPYSQNKTGFTIWAANEARTSWAVRWREFHDDWDDWEGTITFSNADGITGTVDIDLETTGTYADTGASVTTSGGKDIITFGTAYTGENFDGFDFTLTGNPGDTLTFKLYSTWFNSTNDGVFIGAGYDSVLDNCDDATGFRSVEGGKDYRNFIICAPVPVPAAVWLLGSGIIGLIGIGRRCRS
ncbi:MAG: VPLPA-CTERM sorting domain-containing protein [Thermodesulfobacteriota bacterium]|nr:VPLPA-CTERM sorting domain-containing protein [Thermodesulfobacteriota bacterium]